MSQDRRSPAGVKAGRNDAEFRHFLAGINARYRAAGTRSIRLREVWVVPIDDRYCTADVAWTATCAKGSQPAFEMDFAVHYFLQELDGELRVFGWVASDQQSML